jgi:hypothetical protein
VIFKAIKKCYIKYQLSTFQKLVYILGEAQIDTSNDLNALNTNTRNDIVIHQSGEKQLSLRLALN